MLQYVCVYYCLIGVFIWLFRLFLYLCFNLFCGKNSLIMYVRTHIRKSFQIKKFIFSYLYQISSYLCFNKKGY